MERDRLPEIPLRVDINTERDPRPGRGYFQFDIRQNDQIVEFYQDGEHIYTACTGEVFGHDYFMHILGDVINAAMLLKEGRIAEAKLIGERFNSAFNINVDQQEGQEDDRGPT